MEGEVLWTFPGDMSPLSGGKISDRAKGVRGQIILTKTGVGIGVFHHIEQLFVLITSDGLKGVTGGRRQRGARAGGGVNLINGRGPVDGEIPVAGRSGGRAATGEIGKSNGRNCHRAVRAAAVARAHCIKPLRSGPGRAGEAPTLRNPKESVAGFTGSRNHARQTAQTEIIARQRRSIIEIEQASIIQRSRPDDAQTEVVIQIISVFLR